MHGRGEIRVTATTVGAGCELRIHDAGPGISPEARDHLFEPFFTTKARGGGLGLPIARRTAELHGGSLALTCPDTGGSLFTLTLPLRAVADPDTPAMTSEGVAKER